MKRNELKKWIIERMDIGGRTLIYTEFKKTKEIQDSIKEYTSFLKEKDTLSERLYCIINDLKDKPMCPICNEKQTTFNKTKFMYARCCSISCTGRDPERINKVKKTSMERYGVDNPAKNNLIIEKIRNSHFIKYGGKYNTQTKEFKEESKKTCLEKYNAESYAQSIIGKEKNKINNFEKYGGKYYIQTQECRDKTKKTINERYGVEHQIYNQDIKNKISNTINERYGKKWYVETQEFKDKFLETSIKKYGETSPSKNLIVKEKVKKTSIERYGSSSYITSDTHKNFMLEKWGIEYPFHGKYKDYTLPSGSIVKIQGYENFALDILLKQYKEEELLIRGKDIRKLIGKVIYTHNNTSKQYLMDIYLIPENKVIEVKCEFTLFRTLDINLLKRQACLDMGLNYEFWVFNNNGILKIIK